MCSSNNHILTIWKLIYQLKIMLLYKTFALDSWMWLIVAGMEVSIWVGRSWGGGGEVESVIFPFSCGMHGIIEHDNFEGKVKF